MSEQVFIDCPGCQKKIPEIIASCPYCRCVPKDVFAKQSAIRKANDKKRKDSVTHKKCPKCAMDIPKQAEICPYCQSRVKTSLGTMIFTGFLCSMFLMWMMVSYFSTHSTTGPQQPTPAPVSQSSNLQTYNYDDITTYATIIGRAVACGENIEKPMTFVGSWMDRTLQPGSEEHKSQLVVFAWTVEHAAKQQHKGKSPDSCEAVKRVFTRTTWP